MRAPAPTQAPDLKGTLSVGSESGSAGRGCFLAAFFKAVHSTDGQAPDADQLSLPDVLWRTPSELQPSKPT
jgi:hypothetical protein